MSVFTPWKTLYLLHVLVCWGQTYYLHNICKKDPCGSLQLVLLSVGPQDEVLKNTKVGHLKALQLMQWQKSGTLTRVSVTDTWGQRRKETWRWFLPSFLVLLHMRERKRNSGRRTQQYLHPPRGPWWETFCRRLCSRSERSAEKLNSRSALESSWASGRIHLSPGHSWRSRTSVGLAMANSQTGSTTGSPPTWHRNLWVGRRKRSSPYQGFCLAYLNLHYRALFIPLRYYIPQNTCKCSKSCQNQYVINTYLIDTVT